MNVRGKQRLPCTTPPRPHAGRQQHCRARRAAVGFTLAAGLVVGAVIGGLRVRHRLVAVLRDD